MEAEVYRRLVVRLLVPRSGGGRQSALRRCVLNILPNGDWRNRERVDIHLPAEMADEVDLDAIADDVAFAFIGVLTTRKIAVNLKKNRLGQEEVVSDVLLLEACHGFFTPTYKRLAAT